MILSSFLSWFDGSYRESLFLEVTTFLVLRLKILSYLKEVLKLLFVNLLYVLKYPSGSFEKMH